MITFCSLFSGSSGNSVYFSSGETKILIDCGVSGKKIAEALSGISVEAKDLSAILVTHEHSDHTQAVGIMARRYNIPIYANHMTWEHMRPIIGEVKPELQRVFESNEDFNINDVLVHPFSIPHDAAEPVGYYFKADNKKVTLATDIGHINKKLLSNIEGSDMLLIESNHDTEMLKCGKYPYYLKQRILSDVGHLCNEMTGKLVAYLAGNGTTRFLLGHLSKENNFPELAWQTVANALESKQFQIGKDVTLEVAKRDCTSEVYCF